MFDWHIISLDQNAANVVHFDGPKKYPLSSYSWIIPPATVHLSCIVFKQIEFFFYDICDWHIGRITSGVSRSSWGSCWAWSMSPIAKKKKNCVKCLFLVCFALHLFSIQITWKIYFRSFSTDHLKFISDNYIFKITSPS